MSQMKDTVIKDPSPKAEVYAPNMGPEVAYAEGKQGLQGKAPQIGAALPVQAPKMLGKPAKILAPSSAMLTSSSQRDTQTRLHSSGVLRGSQEKDEYLLRLLGKGSKPPLPSAAPSPSSGFRVPDPVPHRAAQASNRPFPNSAAEMGGTAGLEKGSNPGPEGQTATASGQPTSEVAPGWSYSETQRCIGSDAAGSLRATIVSHQVVFLEQLYDLHRAIAVQKLLVRNCPEVKDLMDEAARIVVSSSSGRRDQIAAFAAAAGTGTGTAPSAPPAKRARLENDGPTFAGKRTSPPALMTAALPNAAPAGGAPASGPTAAAAAALVADEPMLEDDGEPGLRPDSQFAAVPLAGETAATGDGSGDDGDGSGPNGSGGNGSGGGSNSPQPQLPPVQLLPPRRLLPLQGAPSEASQAPMMFPRANFMAPPWIQPLMPVHMQMQMQMPPGMDPLVGTGAIPPHYHQQYANLAHMQMAAAAAAQLGGGSGALNGSGSLPQPMAPPPASTAALGGTGAVPVGTAPTAVAVAAAPLSSVSPTPPVLVANPAVPAPGPSGQPSSRPPLPPPQAAPAPGGIAASPAVQVAAAGGDPMAWWAQHYYGRHQQQQQAMQMQMAAQMGPPQNAQQAQQIAGAAAVPAFGNPAAANYRWWQDPTATFGPPVDLDVVAAGIAAATRKAGNAAGEAESAPPSSAAAAAATATAVANTIGTTSNKQKGSQMVAPPPSARPRRSKRKPSDPIEEASSGTTGQDHHLGPHAVTDDAHFKSRSPHGSRGVAPPAAGVIGIGKAGAADTSAAKLLLSFSNKEHVA